MDNKKSAVQKNDDRIAAVVEAAKKKGLHQFLLAFFDKDGDSIVGTTRFNEIKPAQVISLALLSAEQAADLWRRSSPEAPTEFHAVMDTFLADITMASKRMSEGLSAIRDRMK